MGFAPRGRDVERAMEHYASDSAAVGEQEWQAMEWLWNELPWSARFISHFGAANFEWWKRKYVLPLLCRAATPFLERFSLGEWTRSEEEIVRRWFLFFAPIAAHDAHLFSPEVVSFLSDACPSFGGKRGGGVRYETHAQYQALQMGPKPSGARPYEKTVRREEPVSEATKEAARGLIGKLSQLRESIVTLSGGVDRAFCRAFPMRCEMQQTVADIHTFQDELFALLMTVDDGLLGLSDPTLGAFADREARKIVCAQEELLDRIRAMMPSLGSRAEELRLLVDEFRNDLFNSIHTLVRSVDRLSVLDPSNPFHTHQARVVRAAREQIKKFRLSLARGPGPEMTLAQLEEFISRQIGLSEEFHAEGAKIAAIKEKLGRYESHVQVLLSEESHFAHKRRPELQGVLTKITEMRATLTVIPDLEKRFDAIGCAMEELDPAS
jgi:hypothetical protein